MRIDDILHNLDKLKRQMDQVRFDIYSNRGWVENSSLTDEELYYKSKYEFRQFTEIINELRIEIMNTKRRDE